MAEKLTRPEARLSASLREAREPVSPCLEDAIRQLEDTLEKYNRNFFPVRPAIRSGCSDPQLAKQSMFDTLAGVFLGVCFLYVIVSTLL